MSLVSRHHRRHTGDGDHSVAELDEAAGAGYQGGTEVKVIYLISELADLDAVREQFWRRLRRALADVERMAV